MEKWEYKTINVENKGHGGFDISNFNMVVNQLGNVGWELVSSFTVNQEQGYTREVVAIFKRRNNSSLTDSAEQTFEGKAYGHSEKKPRTNREAPRDFRRTSGYDENRADHSEKSSKSPKKGYGYKGKSSGFEGKSSGYKGKSSGYEGKSSGYKGKSSGYAGTDSEHPAKSSGYGEKASGYKRKSFGNAGKGSGPKGRGSGQ